MTPKLIAASVLAFTLSIQAAHATATADVTVSSNARSVIVSYSDLNVRSEAGGKKLLERIDSASQAVCAPKPSASDSSATYTYDMCTLVAFTDAVAQVGDVLFADAGHDGSTVTAATD